LAFSLVSPRTQEIMRRLHRGQSARRISDSLGIKLKTVQQICRRKDFKAAFKLFAEERDKRLAQRTLDAAIPALEVARASQLEAIDTILELMRGSESEEMRFKTAKDVLDRVTTAGPQKQQPSVHIDTFMQQNIENGLSELKLIEARRTRGEAFDATLISEKDSAEVPASAPAALESPASSDLSAASFEQ